jgi:hypothetical protein
LPPLKVELLFTLLLLSAIVLSPDTVSAQPEFSALDSSTSPNQAGEVLGVWNGITINAANARSRRGAQLNPDCTRLGPRQVEVECFSIQQNFWVSDFKGDVVFWVQNVVQLAELQVGLFFATYAFFVWNPKDALQPLFCSPYTFSDNVCRAPIFTNPVRLPEFFAFYANISRAGVENTLYLSNNFADQSWVIPPSIECPCFIDTIRQKPLPWGYSPFEFVVVGIDNGATAFFSNGTNGSVSPGMVQLAAGDWHLATMDTLHCGMLFVCSNSTSTGENSANLRWDNASGRFYWSNGASDQGNYISEIQAQPAERPAIPHPVVESFLYIRMSQQVSVLPTVFDNEGRATGYDASSGSFVQNIPRSFLTLSGEIGIIIVNPNGSYRVALTPLPSGPYSLLIMKEFNTNTTASFRVLNGTLTAVAPEEFALDSRTMTLTSATNYEPSATMLGVGLVWATVIAGIILWLRRRRSSSRDKD